MIEWLLAELRKIAKVNLAERCLIVGMGGALIILMSTLLLKLLVWSPLAFVIIGLLVGLVVFIAHALPVWTGVKNDQ